MLLSALSFLVVAQSSSEVPEGLMNDPVLTIIFISQEANVPYLRTPFFSIILSDFFGVSHIKRFLDESQGNSKKNGDEAPMPEINCTHLLRNQLLYGCAGLTIPTSISNCGLHFSSSHTLITELFYNGINFNNQDIIQIYYLIRYKYASGGGGLLVSTSNYKMNI